MNKNDAMARIEAIEKESAELRKMLSEEKPVGLWRPKQDESVFLLSAAGTVSSHVCSSHACLPEFLAAYLDAGSGFKTREAAEKAAPEFARMHKIIQAAFQVDPDAGSYGNNRGYCAVRGRGGKPWIGYLAGDELGSLTVCVHTREQADAMAAILNAEGV